MVPLRYLPSFGSRRSLRRPDWVCSSVLASLASLASLRVNAFNPLCPSVPSASSVLKLLTLIRNFQLQVELIFGGHRGVFLTIAP
jgi:hypothetical protein